MPQPDPTSPLLERANTWIEPGALTATGSDVSGTPPNTCGPDQLPLLKRFHQSASPKPRPNTYRPLASDAAVSAEVTPGPICPPLKVWPPVELSVEMLPPTPR